MPGKTFNYWVVAKKDYLVEGETVTQFARSQPSPKQTATMVDENELDKQLGLQDYWSYATVPIGNANGYINVSSGNLVYQQVDLEMVAPLLASTMRRTYNSQAKSYTALGKGWDFGLNTNLLREYEDVYKRQGNGNGRRPISAYHCAIEGKPGAVRYAMGGI